MKVQCPSCAGRRMVQTPTGNLWQMCPTCGGTGATFPQYKPEPFSYVINPASAGQVYVTGSATVRGSLQIDPKADFLLRKIVVTSTSTFTIEFTDSSGRTWQNLPVNNANFFGTAQLPRWITARIILAMRTTLNWNVVETSTSNNTIQIVLEGEDLYPIGPTTQATSQGATAAAGMS